MQVNVCLVGFEKHKATPDISDVSGFWLRVSVLDASPFVLAFKTAPTAFHDFLIGQRIGNKIRSSTLKAQITKIEEGSGDARVLLRPHPVYGSEFSGMP